MYKKSGLTVACVLLVLSPVIGVSGIASHSTDNTTDSLQRPVFEITFSGPGRIYIKNIGDANATNVHVRRYLQGGLILVGQDKTATISNIPVGETREANLGMILGLGKTMINFSVSCDEGVNAAMQIQAMIILFLIKMN
jgi:hypothetical protein